MFFESNQQHVHPENGYALHHREISREQMQRFESYMAEIFESFGLDAQTSGTVETPQRFLQALFEATDGYEGDPKLLTVFDAPGRGEADGRFSQVIEGPIPFFALCEHHAFHFYGVAYIGYIPTDYRHFQAHPARATLCQAFHRPRTAGSTGRCGL